MLDIIKLTPVMPRTISGRNRNNVFRNIFTSSAMAVGFTTDTPFWWTGRKGGADFTFCSAWMFFAKISLSLNHSLECELDFFIPLHTLKNSIVVRTFSQCSESAPWVACSFSSVTSLSICPVCLVTIVMSAVCTQHPHSSYYTSTHLYIAGKTG